MRGHAKRLGNNVAGHPDNTTFDIQHDGHPSAFRARDLSIDEHVL
jgi:hypothetical protein